MSAVSQYAELLKLIEVSGPFISLPVFKDVFPQGLGKDSPEQVRELRELYEAWCAARTNAPGFVTPAEREWLRAVFTTLLNWPAEWIAEDNAIPQNLSYRVPQHHETLRPDAVLLDGEKPRILISVLAPSQQPDRRPSGSTWNTTCAARMAELLHATQVSLGLVTNGERFTLIYAEPGQPTGFADFRAELWFDERLTLRAFRDLLSSDALFNRPPEQTLDALYRKSLENQQEVSTTLGRQVRRAVEMFVAALDRADRESGCTMLAGASEEQVYEASLSLMMRLVFLFFAEERDLLPVNNVVFNDNYAVSTLHAQLRASADRLGEEVLERRYDAFPRLLATFRAVHAGVLHDFLPMPSYGGDLFDPDRFPFLEGRAPGSDWRETSAHPLPVHNRTVLHLLEALQFLEMKVPGGGREKRRLSFRALDIEQIGHVYEGLLDHTVRRAPEIVLGLEGKEEPELPLSELNRRREEQGFAAWLAEETGRSLKAVERALGQTTVDDPLRWPEWEQVSTYAGLVRRDDNGDPVVIPAGSLYVTAGTARRQTGTQYTPRLLTESVVEHALTPLVFEGPAEGVPPENWRLKSAASILNLKVCDPACGSAAFLVAAGRFLASRLVEAWEVSQRVHGVDVQITPYGDASVGLPGEELIPVNSDERGLYALRLVVERCLYGVDRNPLAVEMAKLSLWLLTLQRHRPFTFLDHSIRCGDSLLGVDLKQLSTWSLSGTGTQQVLFQDELSFAADRREGLMKMQYRPGDQHRMLEAALAKTRRLRAAADRLIATAFEANSEASAAAVAMGIDKQEGAARRILEGRRPFHWPVEFPEVFLYHDGFDAIVGNPPFLGGSKLDATFGSNYRAYLVSKIANGETGVRGSADLCTYFLLRAEKLCASVAMIGLVVTNSLAQGDARDIGFTRLLARGNRIIRAENGRAWPGNATVFYSLVWLRKGNWHGGCWVDGNAASVIDASLSPAEAEIAAPVRLHANSRIGFEGAKLSGEGFVVPGTWAQDLLGRQPQYELVLRPYLTGALLNGSPDLRPREYVITFYDWPRSHSACVPGYSGPAADEFPECLEWVERNVKPGRLALPPSTPWNRKLREFWWHFGQWRWALDEALTTVQQVLVLSRVTTHLIIEPVDKSWVFSDRLTVFATDSRPTLAVLQSSIHQAWSWRHGTTNLSLLSYSPSACFLTLPLPGAVTGGWSESSGQAARLVVEHRRQLARDRGLGLTEVYNRFHSPGEVSLDIEELRKLHAEMDNFVAGAYGWTDLDLGHGFHETKQGTRYTISEAARREVLDRLLELNHARHAAEAASPSPTVPKPKRPGKKRVASVTLSLFDEG